MTAPKRRWRVTAIEWLSHDTVIEAHSEEEARAEAERLWADNGETEAFSFDDSGLDGFVVEEV
jgi:hypothetical protein